MIKLNNNIKINVKRFLIENNRVMKSTYLLLSITLFFSSLMAILAIITNNKTNKLLPEEIYKEERTTTNVFTPIPGPPKNLRQDITKNGYNSGSPSSQEKTIKVAASLKNSYNKTINGNRKVQNDTNTYGNQPYKGPGYNVINFRNRKQSGNTNLYRSASSNRLSGTARSTEDIFFASSKALQRTKSAYIRKVKIRI